ncbi:MAG: 23S rRNA (uracil(1939)-C(5))-methyltransferase RlmD [Firmicutes bacterium]|nr:23S rRNA (uracil(1939)-C(5))-methyltransferase RlmD [Clostridia bacterium]MBR3260115.1 23S rRNA (uracil(1939)-C(5))-methyltransferase RlmD [Bacillota bacterium]
MNGTPVKKNEELELTIDSVTLEGAGVGRVDGFALFVPGALAGERVRVHVIKVTASYAVGKLMEVVEPSPHRMEPRCPVYAKCGGCAFGHVTYEEELRIKERHVADALTRLGGLTDVHIRPIIGMDRPERYRNKGAFPYGMTDKGPAFGFYAPRSHRLVPVQDCLIEQESVCRAVNAIQTWAEQNHITPYDEGTGKGCLRHAVARVTTSEELMAVIVTRGDLPHKKELIDAMSFADSVYWNRNDRNTNVIFGDRFTQLSGRPTLRETLCGLDFEVSPRSFLQVNPVQTQRLYGAALELLSPQPDETVADVYCGIGTISLLLAQKAGQVIGIEVVPEAVENAKENAARNGIQNASFLCAPAEEALPKLVAEGRTVDCLTVDPPRKGCEPQVIDAILASGARRMVYVSCNPATLARDVKLLTAGGFTVQAVQPVDMFPCCGHVETVCALSKLSEAKHHINVQVDMDELDVTAAESKATYEEIQEWVQKKYGFHVTHLNIAKTKRKCGIIERQNYNLPKNKDSRSPETPKEKEEAIIEAFKAFQMI